MMYRSSYDSMGNKAVIPKETPATSNPPSNLCLIKRGHLTNKNGLKPKYELNPVGYLHELCMFRHWDFPKYESIEMNNSIHKVICSLGVHRSESSVIGKKQAAKNQAAFLMVLMVVDLDETNSIEAVNGEFNSISSVAGMNLNKNTINDTEERKNRRSVMFTDEKYTDTRFFQQLKLSKKPAINTFKNDNSTTESMISYFDFLQTIGEQEGFDVTYIMLSCKMDLDKQVMLQLSTGYTHICSNVGTGNTVEEAEEVAAKCALSYIKMKLEKL